MSSPTPPANPPRHRGGGESKTRQDMRDTTDIGLILKRYAQTGVWDHLTPKKPMYGDFSGATDLQTALQIVDEVTSDFSGLPASVRDVADNNPVRYLELMATEEGVARLHAAGQPIEGPVPPVPPEPPAPVEESETPPATPPAPPPPVVG